MMEVIDFNERIVWETAKILIEDEIYFVRGEVK